MMVVEHVKVTELQETVRSLHLPNDTRLTIIVEERAQELEPDFDEHKALEAMEKLKGLGDGSFWDMLLEDREREAQL